MNMLSLYLKELKENAHSVGDVLDIVYCTLRYGASPVNYAMFGFKNLTGKQRATYVTNRMSRKMIKKYNSAAHIDIFEDKAKFATVFSDFFSRSFVITDNLSWEKFGSFISGINNAGGGFVASFVSQMAVPKEMVFMFMKTGLTTRSCMTKLYPSAQAIFWSNGLNSIHSFLQCIRRQSTAFA